MGRSADGTQPNEASNGFALFAVLWFLVLLGAISFWIMATNRQQIAQARNIVAVAHAESLADGGIAEAVFRLSEPGPTTRWPPDGKTHRLPVAGGAILITITDEAGKVNPNLASDALLAVLFEICGVDAGKAARLGAAIADWVDADDDPHPFRRRDPAYLAAGKGYGPHNAAMNSLDELYLVLGADRASIDRVKPFLSIFATSDEPDSPYTSVAVQRAVALAHKLGGSSNNGGGQSDDASTSNAAAAGDASQQATLASIRAEAHSQDGGVFVRIAVISTQSTSSNPIRS